MNTMREFETLLLHHGGSRRDRDSQSPQLNTIVPPMPDEIEAAIGLAERDPTSR